MTGEVSHYIAARALDDVHGQPTAVHRESCCQDVH